MKRIRKAVVGLVSTALLLPASGAYGSATEEAGLLQAGEPRWAGTLTVNETYESANEDRSFVHFGAQTTVYTLDGDEGRYASGFAETYTHRTDPCGSMTDTAEGSGNGFYPGLELGILPQGDGTGFSAELRGTNDQHRIPITRTGRSCQLVNGNYQVVTTTYASTVLVYPPRLLSGCQDFMLEVPEGIQAIYRSVSTSCDNTITGTAEWDFAVKLEPCNPAVDSDDDGAGDCDEYDRRTDSLNPDTDGDGIKDGPDACPLQGGRVGPNGCPSDSPCDDPAVTDHLYSRADGVAAYNMAAAPNPDFAWFGIGMRWCMTPQGPLVGEGTITQSDLSTNWVFLGALEELGFEPVEDDYEVTVTGTSVRGQGAFGVKTSPVAVILSLPPTGKLLGAAAKGLAKFRSWRKLGMSHDKARDKLDDYVRGHVREWGHALDDLFLKTLNGIPGISRNNALALTEIFANVFHDIGSAFRHRMVSKLIGGKSMTKRAFKRVFERSTIRLWKVDATLQVSASGDATFVNNSKTFLVVDEWEHDTVS